MNNDTIKVSRTKLSRCMTLIEDTINTIMSDPTIEYSDIQEMLKSISQDEDYCDIWGNCEHIDFG